MSMRLPTHPTGSGKPSKAAIERRDVTVKAIAEAVGLSQPAVSQVLNGTGRISPATRQRVLETADQMGYRPNAAARAVVTRKTRQVGVLVLNNPADPETSPHTYSTILGINMALETAGYILCLVRIGDVEQSIEGHSRVFRENVLDGVIVTTGVPQKVADRIQQLVPVCVWADTNVWGKTHCIRRDEVAAGRTAAKAVIDAGYHTIIFLCEEENAGGVPTHYSHVNRLDGIAAVCRREKVPLTVVRQRWDWTPAFSARLAAMLRPDVAVIVSDPFRARIVQEMAAVNKLTIGKDFGVVSCDISGDIVSTWPNLTGVLFDRIELGRQAAGIILAVLEHDQKPPSILLPSQWHAGTSLGRRK